MNYFTNGKFELFVMLAVLKRGQKWNSKAELFEIKSSRFERLVTNYRNVTFDQQNEKSDVWRKN